MEGGQSKGGEGSLWFMGEEMRVLMVIAVGGEEREGVEECVGRM